MLPAARPRWSKRESLPLGTASSPLGPTGFRSLFSSSTGNRPWHPKALLSSSFFRSKANFEGRTGLYKPPVHRKIRLPCPALPPISSLLSSRPRSSQVSLANRCAPSTNAPRERPNARSAGKVAPPVPAAKVASAAPLVKVLRAASLLGCTHGARPALESTRAPCAPHLSNAAHDPLGANGEPLAFAHVPVVSLSGSLAETRHPLFPEAPRGLLRPRGFARRKLVQ